MTGNILWDFVGVADSSSSPTVAGGRVFPNSFNDGKVLALDATTGALLWQTTTGPGAASPVADATRLFFGTTSGHLLALSQTTGAILWDVPLGGEIYAGGTVDGLAFANSFSGIVYALNAETGTTAWSSNTGSGFQTTAMASADGRVFFSRQVANPTLYALDQSTGGLVWSRSGAIAPIVADGLVFAVSLDFHACQLR
jgi:outer membrane protein assembly factor BamB